MRYAWLLITVAAGCYSPKIDDQDYYCGDQGQCPSGFRCIDLVCYKNSTAAPTPYGSGTLAAPDLAGMSGRLELNTATGAIALITATGTTQIVPAGMGDPTDQLSAPDGPQVMIWSFAKLFIPSTIDVVVDPSSQRVPVLSSPDEVRIEGKVLLHEYGFLGGAAGNDGAGYGRGSHALMTGSGGGGAGHGAAGTAGLGTGGGPGGMAYGGGLVLFGSGGAGGSADSPSRGGTGGGGGGAIALLAKKLTVTGSIDVTGGDGAAGVSSGGPAGGGGGGSGGSIYLAGESVTLAGAMLNASGGDGGAGDGGGMAGGKGAAGRITLAGTVTGAPPTASPTLVTVPAIARFPR